MLNSVYKKLKILGSTAKYDTCGPKESVDTKTPGIYWAKTGNGYCRLFKVLQTNACTKNCQYCINQSSSNVSRVSLTSEEMASAFMNVYRKRLVDGLFLSSGISGKATNAMNRILDTTEILRKKYQYKGYIHLKIMPGVGNGYLEKAVSISNRISLNLEAPNKKRLKEIAPDKEFESEVLDTTKRLHKLINDYKSKTNRHVSQTTQFVIGATEESDVELITSMINLYKKLNLTRVFFSSFEPIKGTFLENRQPSSLIRKHRLYQADWLYRFYGFTKNDIYFDKRGKLNLDKDPKLVWAESHPEEFPIEINKANYKTLLKIPGIGPDSAKRLIVLRKKHGIFYNHSQIDKLGISLKRTADFITVAGKYRKQLRLF